MSMLQRLLFSFLLFGLMAGLPFSSDGAIPKEEVSCDLAMAVPVLKAASLTFNVSFEVLYQAYKEGDCLVTFIDKTALGYRFEVAYGGELGLS